EKSQDRERLEILVVDCGSRDDSPNLDTDYPGITMMRLPHNFGATKAMNIATRTAKAETLFYLSPSVEVAPDTVVKLAEKLDAEQDNAAVCPLLIDGGGQPASKIHKFPTANSLSGDLPLVQPDLSGDSAVVEYAEI